MKKQTQTGSAQAVIIIGLALALLTALGWIFWQNFILKTEEPSVAVSEQQTTPQTTTEKAKTLELKELGKTLDLADAPFDDIAYEMTSVNSNDKTKNVVAIYSKSVLESRVSEQQKMSKDIDYSNDYFKLSSNNAVYVYYYEPSKNGGADMIDGVASNIINPDEKTDASKLYIGSMGSVDPGDQTPKIETWLKEQLK